MKISAIALLLVVCSVSRVTLGFDGDPYSDEGCGTERGCYNCGDTCGVNVAYEPDMEAGVVKFSLWGTMVGNEGHVSMGITTTQNMFDADVYSCITNGTNHRLVRSWNPSSRTTESRNLTGRVRDVEVSVMDGEIRCQFTRYMSLDNNDPEFFNISGDSMYYLIVSRGSSLNANYSSPEGPVGGHDERGASDELVLSMVSAGNMVTTQSGTEEDPYSDEGCGDKRGCYNCPGTCGVNVAYEPDMEAGVVKFTLWGNMGGNEAHVSMGITQTQDMYDADVYSCITNSTTHRLVRSWNPSSPDRTTEPRNLTGRVRDVEVSVMDGEIRCQFTRYMSLDNNDPEFFNISGDSMYYLIVSRGSSLNAEGLVAGHDERGASDKFVLSMVSAGNMVAAQFGMWTFILSLIVALRVY